MQPSPTLAQLNMKQFSLPILLVSLIYFTLWLGSSTLALATVTTDLPDRPTLTPTSISATSPTLTPTPHLLGSQILLDLSAISISPLQGTAVVQWQNEVGEWFDVTGWQSELNTTHTVVWWVAPENFGETPFRWVIRTHSQLLISPPFTLPTSSGQLLRLQADTTWVQNP